MALQGNFAKRFFRFLDPLHNPPHNLLYMRIVRLLELAFHREYRRLIDDNVVWLGWDFASTNSDFYRNPERRESYGCIVANMASIRYEFKEGRQLFISKQTLNEEAVNLLACHQGLLTQLETVMAFKKYDGAHTGKGIGLWLKRQHQDKGLLAQYVGYHCTDGASNAVASVNEYELLTEMNRATAINHQKCLAHQTNRSAKYASGTGDFKVCSNPVLSEILTKTHNIVARVHRSYQRLEVIRDVQRQAKRLSVVLPSPGVPTRWDSTNREVSSVNRIMGDFNKGLHLMINGMDKDKLTAKDGTVRMVSDFTFTPTDKLILRQFECASEPCVMLSKFYQVNGPTSHETLFVTTAYLALMRDSSFVMYDDISHTELEDLKIRKKTVYVLSSSHVVTDEDTGRKEQPMDPCIELFRKLYVNDMSHRCGLTEDGESVDKLPKEIAMALLLNPMYGGKAQGEESTMNAPLFVLTFPLFCCSTLV
jgi:hypothetical protein